jgi:UrcA family protein
MHKIIVSTLAAFGLSVLASTPAHAEETTVEVRFSDLNLTTERGIDRLNGRIKTAARMVCGEFDPRNLARARSWRQCRRAAEQSASTEMARVIENQQRFALASMPQRAGSD